MTTQRLMNRGYKDCDLVQWVVDSVGAARPPYRCAQSPTVVEEADLSVRNRGETVLSVTPDLPRSTACRKEDQPLFRLPGEDFGAFTDRVLMYLDLKEGGVVSGDVKPKENRRVHPASRSNPFTVLDRSDMDGCSRSSVLYGRARTLVRFFESQGLIRTSDLPPSIECGGLRAAVRGCFPRLDLLWELSFKTIAKIERDCCEKCLPTFKRQLSEWIEGRSQPVQVDEAHLLRFRNALSSNIEKGWDRRRTPFIPNGNASLAFKRSSGGNWNREGFSEKCRAELVFSSGKPRVVTIYSAENSRILGPLHYALHASIKRWGWLLVGDPTGEHIDRLTGADFLSFDYKSATDNIKTAYLKVAVDLLIEKAEALTDDEIRALRVFSVLKVEGAEFDATRGQPMGSLLSFPVLCLINKTVVDLALTAMLEKGEISFREWSSHPLWVNGDDLLLREVRSDTDIRGHILSQGREVGLVVNEEKTMCDPYRAEVNSTLFERGIKLKKTNVSALWMKPDVEDVLGFAAQAACGCDAFRRMVRANAHILSKQQDKHLYALPPHLQRVCRKDKKIRRAITSLPVHVRPIVEGPIRMAVKPEGYYLTRQEEYESMNEEIERVREKALVFFSSKRSSFRTTSVLSAQSFSHARKRPIVRNDELIPLAYVNRYNQKRKEELRASEVAPDDVCEDPPFDGSRINHMIDLIRSMRVCKLIEADRSLERGMTYFASLVC